MMFKRGQGCRSTHHQCYHCRDGSHRVGEKPVLGETVEETIVRICTSAAKDEEE